MKRTFKTQRLLKVDLVMLHVSSMVRLPVTELTNDSLVLLCYFWLLYPNIKSR